MKLFYRLLNRLAGLLTTGADKMEVKQPKIRLRFHRSSLVDSLATTVEIEPTMEAMAVYLRKFMREDGLFPHDFIDREITADKLRVMYYVHDRRIPADVYYVSAATMPMLAIVDQEPEGLAERYRNNNQFQSI